MYGASFDTILSDYRKDFVFNQKKKIKLPNLDDFISAQPQHDFGFPFVLFTSFDMNLHFKSLIENSLVAKGSDVANRRLNEEVIPSAAVDWSFPCGPYDSAVVRDVKVAAEARVVRAD